MKDTNDKQKHGESKNADGQMRSFQTGSSFEVYALGVSFSSFFPSPYRSSDRGLSELLRPVEADHWCDGDWADIGLVRGSWVESEMKVLFDGRGDMGSGVSELTRMP